MKCPWDSGVKRGRDEDVDMSGSYLDSEFIVEVRMRAYPEPCDRVLLAPGRQLGNLG